MPAEFVVRVPNSRANRSGGLATLAVGAGMLVTGGILVAIAASREPPDNAGLIYIDPLAPTAGLFLATGLVVVIVGIAVAGSAAPEFEYLDVVVGAPGRKAATRSFSLPFDPPELEVTLDPRRPAVDDDGDDAAPTLPSPSTETSTSTY